jgi:hypothetical protein
VSIHLAGRRLYLRRKGPQHAGLVQRLIETYRLHGINPYTYIVDMLQCVWNHPASRLAEFALWLWKQLFADSPLRSGIHGVAVYARTPAGDRLPLGHRAGGYYETH